VEVGARLSFADATESDRWVSGYLVAPRYCRTARLPRSTARKNRSLLSARVVLAMIAIYARSLRNVLQMHKNWRAGCKGLYARGQAFNPRRL
jgi:hypothetical protein